MNTSTRKRLGMAALIIALLVGVALYLTGVPLFTLESSQFSSIPGGGFMFVQAYTAHWPFIAVCLFALLGLMGFFWPARKPPRLQS
jgi:hypothetical protein